MSKVVLRLNADGYYKRADSSLIDLECRAWILMLCDGIAKQRAIVEPSADSTTSTGCLEGPADWTEESDAQESSKAAGEVVQAIRVLFGPDCDMLGITADATSFPKELLPDSGAQSEFATQLPSRAEYLGIRCGGVGATLELLSQKSHVLVVSPFRTLSMGAASRSLQLPVCMDGFTV